MNKRDMIKILPKDQISIEVWDKIVKNLQEPLKNDLYDKMSGAIQPEPKREGFVRFFKYKTYVNAIKNLFNKKGG